MSITGAVTVGALVSILPTEGEGALANGRLRVKLPVVGPVTGVKGANGYQTFQVYIEGLGETRGFPARRLKPVSAIDLLGTLER